MPRSKRITLLNHPHLVIAEANGGTELFRDEDDYLNYLSHLKQMARDRLLRVYAYCLRTDELRLVISPQRLALPRIMQRLHGHHSARMNHKLMRSGHLFRGRFRSLLFDRADLIDVVRSVHLWPVRDGLLRRPELYPYSSHAAYMGAASPASDFLSTAEVFDNFSGDLEKKRRAFARFVETLALDIDDFGIEEVMPGIGGQGASYEELLRQRDGHRHIHKKTSVNMLADRCTLLLNISLEQLIGPSRRQDLVMARRLLATSAVMGAGRRVTEVAAFLHRDKAQISRLVAQGMDLLNSDDAFCHMFDSLKARGGVKDSSA